MMLSQTGCLDGFGILFPFLEEDRGIGGVGNADCMLDGEDVLRSWPRSFGLYIQVGGTVETRLKGPCRNGIRLNQDGELHIIIGEHYSTLGTA